MDPPLSANKPNKPIQNLALRTTPVKTPFYEIAFAPLAIPLHNSITAPIGVVMRCERRDGGDCFRSLKGAVMSGAYEEVKMGIGCETWGLTAARHPSFVCNQTHFHDE